MSFLGHFKGAIDNKRPLQIVSGRLGSLIRNLWEGASQSGRIQYEQTIQS